MLKRRLYSHLGLPLSGYPNRPLGRRANAPELDLVGGQREATRNDASVTTLDCGGFALVFPIF